MIEERKEQYDVVIIGAGIGGLICGCSLVKSGLKVLISERTSRPGGYCISFEVKNYEFDAFAHTFGNLSKGAQFYNILNGLGLYGVLDFTRFDPSDTIITKDFSVSFWSSVEKTIDDFSRIFPDEDKQIKFFFNFLVKEENITLIQKTRNKTFRDILDSFFKNKRLKEILGVVVLGNLGTSSYYINAFTAIKHYRQFMLDGGYYPREGAYGISEALAKKFIEMGGKLILSNPVVEVFVKDRTAKGIKLRSGERINSRIVVSDCDARVTFLDLVGKENLTIDFINKMNSMLFSSSLLVVYLGYKFRNETLPEDGVNTWLISDYGYEQKYNISMDYELEDIAMCMIRQNALKKNCTIFSLAPFKTLKYWKANRKKYVTKVLDKALEFYPKLFDSFDILYSIDPSVLNRWTMNSHGAGYGWAVTPTQFIDIDFTRDTIVKNLFLCGHWSTIAQGVDGVAIVGERVANTILYRLKHVA